MPDPKVVAVAGYGAIGRHHARNLASFAGVRVIVIEAHPASADEAVTAGFPAVPTLDEALSLGLDGVVVAIPTALHRDFALQCIAAGKAVLVEKPIASTVADGETVIEAASRADVPLMVGYVERYNPAVIALKRLIDEGHLGRIYSLTARRVGMMPARIKDANVLVDIGVHDIDAAAFVLDRPLRLKSALGGRGRLEDRVDYASLAIDAGGIAVHIETNWLTPVKMRELYVFGEHGTCHVDYITQEARLATHQDISIASTFEGTVENYKKGNWKDVPIVREEPLHKELSVFLAAMNGGPLPNPRIALTSLALAEEATRRIDQGSLE